MVALVFDDVRLRLFSVNFFRLQRMHEMQTIVTDVRGGSLSVARLNNVWCIRAVFVKLLWLFVLICSLKRHHKL